MSPQHLRRVYISHGIRLKEIKLVKIPPVTKMQERQEMTDEARHGLQKALRENVKIIFADETVFTSKTLMKRAYAGKG